MKDPKPLRHKRYWARRIHRNRITVWEVREETMNDDTPIYHMHVAEYRTKGAAVLHANRLATIEQKRLEKLK